MIFPDTVHAFGQTYVKKIATPIFEYHFAWDDENPDYGYKCRTQQPGWSSVDNPPAVIRYYPTMKEQAGDFRVDISAFKPLFLELNDGDEQKFEYWSDDGRAQFNQTGWPQFAYVGMCGNLINILETIGDWVRFETLKVTDLERAKGMTRFTHPHLVHTFTCVTWDRETRTTKRILSTGTPRGVVDFHLVTKEGYAFIPRRHIARN